MCVTIHGSVCSSCFSVQCVCAPSPTTAAGGLIRAYQLQLVALPTSGWRLCVRVVGLLIMSCFLSALRVPDKSVFSHPDPEPMQMGRSRLSQQEKRRRWREDSAYTGELPATSLYSVQ